MLSTQFRWLALTFSACLFLSAQTQAPTGVDLGAIDRAANPCNDFYQYACGTWMKNNPIPPDQARWSRFAQLGETNRTILKGILEKASVDRPDRSASDQRIW